MWRVRILWVAAAVLAGLGVAGACGVRFPGGLYEIRAEALLRFPDFGFFSEVERLVRATGGPVLAARESDPYEPLWRHGSRFDVARSAAEARDLSADAIEAIARMRRAADGRAALEAGVDVPLAARLYTAGAVDFRRGDFAAAAGHFAAVLDLPLADGAPRAVWAAYMLGRSEAKRGDPDAAAAAFRRTRDLALAGAPDPLELAVASYGEEARLSYDAARAAVDADLFRPVEDCRYEGLSWDWQADRQRAWIQSREPICARRAEERRARVAEFRADPASLEGFAASMAQAVALYARQAAAGSASGRASLREIVEFVWRADPFAEALARDTLGLRLLVTAEFAHDFQLDFVSVRARRSAIAPDSAAIDILAGAMERAADRAPEGADRMAALAYEIGRYDLAARLAALSDSAMAHWVGAKLALRAGEPEAAHRRYEAAIAREDALSVPLRARLWGEAASLDSARGRFAAALDRFVAASAIDVEPSDSGFEAWRPPFWADIAHLAERVLTVEELAAWVAARAPDDAVGSWIADVLARRLARAGRYAQASAHYLAPREASLAEAMARDLAGFRAARGSVARAAAGFSAARRLREMGMELTGFEAAPDGAMVKGLFAWPQDRLPADDPFFTPEERARFDASRAVPDRRYHYRYRAADLAELAADRLPRRSQAFAATLCWATLWMLQTGEDAEAYRRSQALYVRYLREGPFVPWGEDFGRACPEPDFAAAEEMRRTQPWRDFRRWARRNKQGLVAGALLGFAGAVSAIVLIVRRRRSVPA